MENDKITEKQETAAPNETLASDTISMLSNQCMRLGRIIREVMIFAGLVVFCLAIINYRYSLANERNNQRWIEYLSQYDFVSQDGEGYNYYNADVGGDVVNGKE